MTTLNTFFILVVSKQTEVETYTGLGQCKPNVKQQIAHWLQHSI